MNKNVIGVFDNVDSVNAALKTLELKGYEKDEISVVSTKDNVITEEVEFENNVIEGVKDTAKTGGVIGGILGLLVGVGALTIPGVGLLFITGPIAAALGLTGLAATTASGALTGALAGGIVGAFREIGVDESMAVKYEEALKAGNIIVGVSAKNADAVRVREIFENNGADYISDLSFAPRSERRMDDDTIVDEDEILVDAEMLDDDDDVLVDEDSVESRRY